MLRATLEIIPHGELSEAGTLATIYIFNLVTDENDVANYGVVIEHENGFYDCKTVEGWPRGRSVKEGGGALNLLTYCLAQPKGKFNPSHVAIINGWKEEDNDRQKPHPSL